MKQKPKRSLQSSVLLIVTAAFLILFSTPVLQSKELKKGKEAQKAVVTSSSNMDRSDCDSSLWQHVYNPWRLHVLESCKEVTGIVDVLGADDDGDEHILLKLDAGQENLVNKYNQKKKKGDLVVEVVCANAINLKAAKKPCKGYLNNVELPSVGEHVKVTGSYVVDIHNGWKEIHPVTRIEKIK